jgi:ectoine hydroxylase-related dioxygenase (phytanoyl-CoA dioxygenase family)
MIKYSLESPVVIKKIKNYKEINKKLLSYFDDVVGESIKPGEGYTIGNNTWLEDSFHKLDWKDAKDFSRPWVQYFLNYFIPEIIDIKNELYYEECHLIEMWFQQYRQNNMHSWHTHGENFTGVYYVELNEKSPKTQIVNPFDSHSVYQLDVSEGDIVIFPSYTLHRAPKMVHDTRKTIISFNFCMLQGMYDIDLRLSKPSWKTRIHRLKNKILGKEKNLKQIHLRYSNEA